MLPPGARAIEDLLRRAGGLGASDLALEPQDDGSVVAMCRLDGVRQALAVVADAASAVARLKALAGLPAYIVDEVQDGRIDGTPFSIPGDLRLAVIPTVRGQRLALRLPAIGPLPPPERLGLGAAVLAGLRGLLRRPDGLLVLAGPTGSGKTTTLHSLLTELARERADRSILTIEDPVERRLPGLTQVEVQPGRGLGFAEALSAGLRHDADVIVVGEVRDPATATACVRAALTGHLVVTTVHAARAVEIVPRLTEMGVDRDLLSAALVGLAAQRLVRTVHADCNGAGCAGCSGGMRGRRVLAELLPVDAAVRAAWRHGEVPTPGDDLDRQAAALIASRETTPAEVARVLGTAA